MSNINGDRKALADEDDWETDPDFINNVTEEEQRWGGARDTGVLDMDKLRSDIRREDNQATEKRKMEDSYKTSSGYGGKFGVLTDRQDKSAVGWDDSASTSNNNKEENCSK